MVETKTFSAAEARSKADECREMARDTTQENHRVMLQHMAGTWERIAKDIEAHSQ